jgi:gliding motility associated protien GldN
MNLKKSFFFLFAVFISSYNVAQGKANILNAKTVAEIGVKSQEQIAADATQKPLAYGIVKDDDILWSKVVWEVIDLNQKINHPFYFPIENNTEASRLSLYNTLANALNSKDRKFKMYKNSYLKEKDTISLKKINTEKLEFYCRAIDDVIPFNPSDITHFKIKGMWFFDKLQGELKYRLLAIGPVLPISLAAKCINFGKISDNRQRRRDNPNARLADIKRLEPTNLEPLYWLYFPEVRQVLHNAKVFNPKNGSRPISFDHLLNARRFGSVIVQEENMYGNRAIEDYVRGNSFFELLEAERIKEDIRNREMDMWNY